jgi:hypothetical protein
MATPSIVLIAGGSCCELGADSVAGGGGAAGGVAGMRDDDDGTTLAGMPNIVFIVGAPSGPGLDGAAAGEAAR